MANHNDGGGMEQHEQQQVSSKLTFKDKTIEEKLKSSFKDSAKTKINSEAVKLTNGKVVSNEVASSPI